MKLFVIVSVALYTIFSFSNSARASISTDDVTFSGRVGGDIRTIYSGKTLINMEGMQNSQALDSLNQSGHITILNNKAGDIIIREVDM